MRSRRETAGEGRHQYNSCARDAGQVQERALTPLRARYKSHVTPHGIDFTPSYRFCNNAKFSASPHRFGQSCCSAEQAPARNAR